MMTHSLSYTRIFHRAFSVGLASLLSACAALPAPQQPPLAPRPEPIPTITYVQHTAPQPSNYYDRQAPLTEPCWACFAFYSQGGGTRGHTAAVMDLKFVGTQDDVAFPRALTARIESDCAICEPAAIQAQTISNNPDSTIWAANFETYTRGRATVLEFNMGAANGGYVMHVVPTRTRDGFMSKIDAVIGVEGFGYDPYVTEIGSYINARIRPTEAMTIIPSDQGAVTITMTSDGRMKELWIKIDNRWFKQLWIDSVLVQQIPPN